MTPEPNPYESPIATESKVASPDLRRPVFGTILIGVWILEGGFKVYMLLSSLVQFGPQLMLNHLAAAYPDWNRLVFFLYCSFMTVETIGPWIGVYYLTGRRARSTPFHTALIRTLLVAGGIAIVVTLLLMLYCELAGVRS